MKSFLQTKNTKIIGFNGKSIQLKGTNFGGWLMMEAYFMHSPNYPARKFKKEFKSALGERALRDFEKSFNDHFIRESDMKNIKALGFNCVRVPFNYSLIEKKPFEYDMKGVGYLDKVVSWAKKYKVWIILDFHGAQGCQNNDWHSDSYGEAALWTKRKNQDRAVALWTFLADRYKDEEWIAGYDLLNESVLKNNKKLNHLYKRMVKAIRAVDKNHILFVEGNQWAQDINCLDPIDDDNHVLSIHYYIPLDFTFNFHPHLKYPLKGERTWNKSTSKEFLERYVKTSKKRNVPIYVGEFGVNYRNGIYNEHLWLRDTLKCFNENGFHWTYWTYKAIKNSAYPDGIYSYYPNPPWVSRHGPLHGWDTYKLHWKTQKLKMIKSWHTNQFTLNTHVAKTLKDAL